MDLFLDSKPDMWKRNLIIGILIITCALAVIWLKNYRALPKEQDSILLKDGTRISGEIVKQEFGKYVVIQKVDDTLRFVIWDEVKDINLFNRPWYFRIDEVLDWVLKLGVLGGFIVFGVGLFQYSDAQKWKRSEFLVKEIKEFELNDYVVEVRTMLDYDGRLIYLHRRVDPPVFVDNQLLATSLARPDKAKPFSRDEQAIRYAFDYYLSNLDLFNHFIDLRLVKKNELKFFLDYWLKIIGNRENKHLNQEARTQLWDYIFENDFRGTVELLRKFGYRISTSKNKSLVSRIRMKFSNQMMGSSM